MINPTPVESKSTPYSYASNSGVRPTLPKNIDVPPPKKRRPWRRFLALFLLSFLVAGVTYVFAEYNSLRASIFQPHQGKSSSILSLDPTKQNAFDADLFKQAGDGRFNIVVVGVGGEGHAGAYLTDSIQVISLDTLNKKINITSVPRDLYVSVPSLGYRGKINAVYEQAEQKEKGSGALALRQVVGSVLGVTISNFGLVDFSAAKEMVDTLGGIDITVPKALYDPLFPADQGIGYITLRVPAGYQHMDGTTALRYARSRETTSDFDRSARQQLVIAAIKEKALSLGTISNPAKVTGILNALGQHVQTDMTINEIEAFVSIYKSVPSDQTTTNVLDNSAGAGLLTDTTDPVAGYIEYPLLGYNNYTAIHNWYQKNAPDPFLLRENPTITIVAGGYTTAKQLQTEVDSLKDYGYNVLVGSPLSDKTQYRETTLFDTSNNKKPFSHQYLSSLLGVSPQNGSPLSSGSDYELVYLASSK